MWCRTLLLGLCSNTHLHACYWAATRPLAVRGAGAVFMLLNAINIIYNNAMYCERFKIGYVWSY